jgi:hypothetical protein
MPVSSFHRRAAALWNILDHHERATTTIGWWASWPAEAVRGHVVSQRFFLSSFGVGPIGGATGIGVVGENPTYAAPDRRLTWPEELAAELGRELGGAADRAAADSGLGDLLSRLRAAPHDAETAHDLAVVDNIHRTDLLVAETIAFLERRDGPSDLSAIYLEGVDVASHLFWKHLFPDAWQAPDSPAGLPDNHRAYAPIIPLMYGEADRVLGRLLDDLDERTVLVVVSDHGFRSHLDPFDYDYSANRLLEALGLCARDADGEVDHARSRWFDHGGHPWESRREIFLNVRRTFPEGVVDPADADRAMRDLEGALNALRSDNGEHVVASIERLENAPGLRVRIHPRLDRSWRVRVGDRVPSVADLFPPRTLSGNHRPEGIVAFYGGGVRPGRLEPMSSLDITPTLLPLLGLPVADDMDGRASKRVLDDLDLEIRTVDSYDFLVKAAEDRDEGSTHDRALRERLRSLGYID